MAGQAAGRSAAGGGAGCDESLSRLVVSRRAGARRCRSRCWRRCGRCLERETVPKAVHDAKALELALAALGIEVRNIAEDAMLYAFLLCGRPGRLRAGSAGGALPGPQAERGRRTAGRSDADHCREAAAGGGAAGSPLRCTSEIDLPLAPVLARMEETGIRVDTEVLAELSSRLADRIDAIAAAGL